MNADGKTTSGIPVVDSSGKSLGYEVRPCSVCGFPYAAVCPNCSISWSMAQRDAYYAQPWYKRLFERLFWWL